MNTIGAKDTGGDACAPDQSEGGGHSTRTSTPEKPSSVVYSQDADGLWGREMNQEKMAAQGPLSDKDEGTRRRRTGVEQRQGKGRDKVIGRHFDQSDDRASCQRRRLYRQPRVGHSLAGPGTKRIVRSGLF
jgi:hypothetical protein